MINRQFFYSLTVLVFLALSATSSYADDVEKCNEYYNAKDYTQALPHCQKAAEQGYVDAQNNLGDMYRNGHGVTEDRKIAVEWLQKAAEQGYVDAQNNLGDMYRNGYGANRDYKVAAKWFQKAAEQGDAGAQSKLGNMYVYGDGVTQDYKEAAKWYEKAAEQGNKWAQFDLGRMYQLGKGIPQDYQVAAKWYQKAAEQRYPLAQYMLDAIYGDDSEKCTIYDAILFLHEALLYCERAAEQGDATAQNNLGNMYYYGRVTYDWMYNNRYGVVKRDYKTAVQWFKKAAEQGDASAQDNLGVMYANGQGVITDRQEALVWFSLAASQGHEKAIKNRGIAENRLTNSEVRAARQEAKRRQAAIEKRQQQKAADDEQSDIFSAKSAIASAATPAQKAFENSWQSVVVVYAGEESQGSGVIVRPNIVATNCHVLEDGADSIQVYKAVGKTADKSRFYSATIHRFNIDKDLCLLSVAGLNGQVVSTRRAESLSVGEAVFAIGAPEGLDYSISGGIVSQLRADDNSAPIIQTDAAISPGSSGGGLFDSEGDLVGITTKKLVNDDIEGIAFALPTEWVLDLLE